MLKKYFFLLTFFVIDAKINATVWEDNVVPCSIAEGGLEEPHVPLNGIVSVVSYLPKLRFLNVNALPLGIFLLIKQI